MARWENVLDRLVRERGRALVGYAYLLTGSAAEAEDLVQDALVKTFVRGRTAADVGSAEAYTRRAILTTYIDGFRRRRHWATIRHLVAASDDGGSHAMPGPDSSVPTRLAVDHALSVLSPRERACAVLRFYDDLTIAQIADRLSLSTGTVKRYLSDATHKLEGALGPIEQHSGEEFETTPVQSKNAVQSRSPR